jgi:hypothetical protein
MLAVTNSIAAFNPEWAKPLGNTIAHAKKNGGAIYL